jgi:nucleoid-associated protein YgaU
MIYAMSDSNQTQWTYTVKPNDKTMADVAREVYGDPTLARQISAANPFASPNSLVTGQQLAIPVLMGPEGKATYPRRCDGTPVYHQ